MNDNHRRRPAALMSRACTTTLVTSLRVLSTPRDQEETLARAWAIEELERRFPAAADAVAATFEAELAGDDVDYVAVLLKHIPGV